MSKPKIKEVVIILEEPSGLKHHFTSLYEASKILRIPYGNIRRSKSEGRTSVNGYRVRFL